MAFRKFNGMYFHVTEARSACKLLNIKNVFDIKLLQNLNCHSKTINTLAIAILRNI